MTDDSFADDGAGHALRGQLRAGRGQQGNPQPGSLSVHNHSADLPERADIFKTFSSRRQC